MKRLTFFLPLLFLLFAGCSKEEPLKVVYTIDENTQATPEYYITYTSDRAGGTTIKASSSDHWSSGEIMCGQGQTISMKVECNDPTFDITFKILVNGFEWKADRFTNPAPSGTVSGTLDQR